MKKFLILLLLCVGVGMAVYFIQRKNPIVEKMEVLYGQKVTLPLEAMSRVVPDGYADTLRGEAKYKMVVFYDSVSCSSCAYKNLYHWNEFIEEVNKHKRMVRFYFIMNPSEERRADLYHAMQMPNGFVEALYVDTMAAFVKANAFLPAERLYHCMLLDEGNRIVLVGNPTANQQLWELYTRTIMERH